MGSRYFKNYNNFPLTFVCVTKSSTLPIPQTPTESTFVTIDANEEKLVEISDDFIGVSAVFPKDSFNMITGSGTLTSSYLYRVVGSGYVEPNTDLADFTYIFDGSIYNSYWTDYYLTSASSARYGVYYFTIPSSTYVSLLGKNITYTGAQSETVAITNNTTNCSVTYQNESGETVDSFNVSDNGKIILTCNDNYKWSDTVEIYQPTITTTSSGGVVTTTAYSTDYKTATITITSFPTDITINGTPTVIQNVGISATTTHCSVTWTPENVLEGTPTEITFTATCDDGYYFETAPILNVYESGVTSGTVDFVISSDTLTASLTYTTNADTTTLTVEAVATIKPDVPTTGYSFVNVYHCTKENIESLGAYRFSVASGSSPINIVDLGYYVTSLKRFYCDIPDSIDSTIALATIDTKISAKLVSADTVTLDCGSVAVESTNNNSNDYSNTTVSLLLPFIGLVDIDVNLVMNRTISLEYKVSCISGMCVAFIKDVETNVILECYSGNIAENIPYILNNITYQMLGNFETENNILYGFTPTVIIAYHNNYNEDNTAMIANEQYALLSTLNGLNCVDNLVINNTAIADDEKTLIISELQNGVIF